MPAIVLRDEASVDIGCLLVAGSASLQQGQVLRDIVLMKLPHPSSSPLSEFLEIHNHIEFLACIDTNAGNTTLSFDVSSDISFQAQVTETGSGSWIVSSLGGSSCQVLSSVEPQ